MMPETSKADGLVYEICGAGQPVVLLHGLTLSRGIFAPLMELLRPEFLCVAPDLPGHGDSDPAGEAVDFVPLAEQLHGLVRTLALPPPIIVAHSFAAGVAVAYAAQFPVRGVVTLDQASQVVGFAEIIRAAGEEGAVALWGQVRLSFGVESLPASAAALVAGAEQPADPLVRLYWRSTIRRTAAESQAMFDAWLRQIKAPFVEILAQEPGVEYRDWLRGLVPQAQTMVLPGATHFPQLSAPAEVAQAIREVELAQGSGPGV